MTPERFEALRKAARDQLAQPLSSCVAITAGELRWLLERAEPPSPDASRAPARFPADEAPQP